MIQGASLDAHGGIVVLFVSTRSWTRAIPTIRAKATINNDPSSPQAPNNATPNPPLQYRWTASDYTQDQLERDTVRGFNGYAGGLHEYRVHVDTAGNLVVNIDAAGTTGTAEWETVPVAARGASGDPNYVEHVYAQVSF